MTRRDDDLDRELQTHLELEAEERMADGLSEADARHAARRAFGNVTRAREDVRGVWLRPWIDRRIADLRYAVRTLLRYPAFSTVCILTLALGIGANTAIFSVVNAVLLKPLPYPRPEQLMFLTSRIEGFDEFWVSAPEYFEFTEMNSSFALVGAFRTGDANVSALSRPRRVRTADVNGELLEALGVPAARGRWFTRAETGASPPPIVILSDALWRDAYGSRDDVVGTAIEIDGVRREVVGVMPPGFDVMDGGIDVWLPLPLDPANRAEWNRGTHIVYLVGRLKEGVQRADAEAELVSLNAGWRARIGGFGHMLGTRGHVLQMEPMQEGIVGAARPAIWALQAAVAFVLLIACATLANLMMARAEARRRELAVRSALGAGRGRLFGQFVAEGLVVSLAGGVAAVALAYVGVGALRAIYPGVLPRATGIAIDPSVLAFTLTICVGTALAFGAAPLVQLPVRNLTRAITESATRTVTAGRHGVRRTLVAVQIGFAVIVLTGASLMLRTVSNLLDVDAGFDRSRAVTFGIGLPGATYSDMATRRQVYERVLDGLGNLPGVEGVAAMSGLPPQRQFNAVWTDIEGYTPRDRPVPVVDYYQTVTSGYFDVMRTPIVRGRGFVAADAAGGSTVVVNETFARTFWNGLDPIGRRIRSHYGGISPWLTVVGVAKDVKQAGVDQSTGTEVYFLLDQIPRIFPAWFLGEWGSGGMNIVVRSAAPMNALQASIGRVVGDADPSLPIIRLREMEDVVRQSVQQPRMLMHLFGGFAALSLLLAAIGTYSVLSWLVTDRRRDIGIRLALGARRDALLRQVMTQSLTPAAAGIALGLAGALIAGRWMATLLFGIEPTDPLTLVTVAGGALIAAAIASFLPARRAMRVDPAIVLRAD